MIPVPPGVRVLIATRPVDFRKGADSLAALAKERLGQDPFSGAVLVFRSRSADRVKILVWDGSGGLGLVWKRLEQGAFKSRPVIGHVRSNGVPGGHATLCRDRRNVLAVYRAWAAACAPRGRAHSGQRPSTVAPSPPGRWSGGPP